MLKGCGFVACQQFSNVDAAGWVRKFSGFDQLVEVAIYFAMSVRAVREPVALEHQTALGPLRVHSRRLGVSMATSDRPIYPAKQTNATPDRTSHSGPGCVPIGDVALNRFVHHVWRSFPAPTQHASYTKTVVSLCLACAMSP
jgi:hypothetical protein